MNKKHRQTALIDIIRSRMPGNQRELHAELKKRGIDTSQSSISRDLIELGITKVRGTYQLPVSPLDAAKIGTILELDAAGDHLIVVKTAPGQASMMALAVDREKIPGIVGTVAGDDTFFIAVRFLNDQKTVIRRVRELTS